MSTAGEISGGPLAPPRDALDWYIEPRWTVDLLLDEERFAGNIWDPACGSGVILKACAERYGIDRVTGSDIADRGVGGVQDFLAADTAFVNVDNIITNPPYAHAEAFVRRALETARRKVAVLVQAKFTYSQARHALFTARPPARLYFLSSRPSMPPGELLLAGKIKPEGGKLDFLWIVWDAGRHDRVTEARWLMRGAR